MLKKILIISGVIAVLMVVAFLYLNNRNRTMSPAGSVEYAKNGLEIKVDYSRPSVRGRLVFGTEAEEALQPYGKYWRLGANEVTTIEINKDVLFNKQELKAGKYALYAIPGDQQFIIGVNTEVSRWGYSEPDYSKDLFTTNVNTNTLPAPVEQFTAHISDRDSGGATLFFDFGETQIVIPIDVM